MRHRARSLLPLPKRLFGFEHFGPLEVPDLDRQPLQARADHGERGEVVGVAVAAEYLRRDRRGAEAEPFHRHPLHFRRDVGERADRARELADADVLGGSALKRSRLRVHLVEGERELEPERRRLGVDAVRAADRECGPVLLRPHGQHVDHPVERRADVLVRPQKPEAECRIDDVGGGQPVVHPLPLLTQRLRDGPRESDHVVPRRRFDLVDAVDVERRFAIERLDILFGDDAGHLAPRRTRRQFDVEPRLKLAVLTPEVAHFGAGVSVDHGIGTGRVTRSRKLPPAARRAPRLTRHSPPLSPRPLRCGR